ncbi:MAG: guanosine monophosphate reductase [Candidatus Dormibacteria bacterium]
MVTNNLLQSTLLMTAADLQMAFDYDTLSLVPRLASTVEHRNDVDPSVDLPLGRLSLPLVSSPMPDVTGDVMCDTLAKEGVMGVFHRFLPIEQHVSGIKTAIASAANPARVAAAIGITGDYQERYQALHEAGCRVFCLDTANGAHTQVSRSLEWIRSQDPTCFLMAGNVASKEAFSWLEDAGADGIRVGIAGGSVCETKTETGVYAPTPWAVYEAASVRKRALIIGDSGVRTPADMCKLLALGADLVMVGSAFAGTKESPGRILMVEGKKFKIMRGAASFSVQQEVGRSDPEYVEGAETLVPYKGSVREVLQRYSAGLRSSMSYMNARTLEEFRENVSFIRIG